MSESLDNLKKNEEEESYGVCTRCGWTMSYYVKNLWCLVCDGDMVERKRKKS